jgi:hypothetical protein
MPQEIDQPPGTKYNNGQNQRSDKKPLVFVDGIQTRKQNHRKEDVQKQRPANRTNFRDKGLNERKEKQRNQQQKDLPLTQPNDPFSLHFSLVLRMTNQSVLFQPCASF